MNPESVNCRLPAAPAICARSAPDNRTGTTSRTVLRPVVETADERTQLPHGYTVFAVLLADAEEDVCVLPV